MTGNNRIRVELPPYLRSLAHVTGEVKVDVTGLVTQRSILDAIEAAYPMLSGTIRDHVTQKRRPFLRFVEIGENRMRLVCVLDPDHQEVGDHQPEEDAGRFT